MLTGAGRRFFHRKYAWATDFVYTHFINVVSCVEPQLCVFIFLVDFRITFSRKNHVRKRKFNKKQGGISHLNYRIFQQNTENIIKKPIKLYNGFTKRL